MSSGGFLPEGRLGAKLLQKAKYKQIIPFKIFCKAQYFCVNF